MIEARHPRMPQRGRIYVRSHTSITTFMHRGFGAVEEANRSQIDYLFAGMVRHWENVYLQYCAAYLSEEAWSARQRIIEAVARSPGFSASIASPLGGGTISGSFLEHAEQVRREQGLIDPEDT